jgi:hypothetical protein
LEPIVQLTTWLFVAFGVDFVRDVRCPRHTARSLPEPLPSPVLRGVAWCPVFPLPLDLKDILISLLLAARLLSFHPSLFAHSISEITTEGTIQDWLGSSEQGRRAK